jgi:glycosyltransferase involved in cell wall biosynthesis
MNRVFHVARRLRRELRARAIDVVHSNANYDRTVAALAAAGTQARHVAGIHSTHSIQHNITHWLRNRWGVAHFITDAEAGKQVLIRDDHISADRITAVPIGIEETPPGERSDARRATRARLGIGDSTVVIGNVARLVPFKGHKILLEAAHRVVQQVPDVLFLIIGDGELQATLEAQAGALGIAGNARFLGFRDDLHLWYPAFDVYCHSSLDMAEEMFPIAILRALSAGLPAVCTRVGGIAGMIREGFSGHLVAPGDPEALAAALVPVIRKADLRTRMGEGAVSLFRDQFHATAMAERVESVYVKTLEGP